MCIILIGQIDRDLHEQALAENGDGFSVLTKNGLFKSPSKKQINKALNRFAIWHYRIGTSGLITDYNIHPFDIGDWYLYHNGIFGAGLGDKSDTHLLADLLKDKPFDTINSVLQSLSKDNRILLVNKQNPEHFITYGDWVFNKGILMSHNMYEGGYNYAYSKYSLPKTKSTSCATKESINSDTQTFDFDEEDWEDKYYRF